MVIIASIAFAIATVILVANTDPATAHAAVIHVQSSLNATGRNYACPGEPLIFTCEVNGQYIQWTFNSYYRTTFFFDDSVNAIETVSGQYGVRAILTGNDPIPNSPSADFKHLTSALIIDSLSGYLHNISCSSDTETHTQQLKIAETPNTPLNVRVNKPAPHMLSVTWDAPVNNEKFDLEHFKVHIMLPEQESYITNGTSMIPEYQFHSDMIPSNNNNIHITITVVSKCSQQALRSVAHSIHSVNEWMEAPDITASTVKGVSEAISNSESEKANGNHDIMMNGCKKITDMYKVVLALILATSILFSPRL